VRSGGLSRRRGDPLLVLAMVVGGWVLLRAAAWSFWPDMEPAQAGPGKVAHEIVATAPHKSAVAPLLGSPADLPMTTGYGPMADSARIGPQLRLAPTMTLPRPAPLPPVTVILPNPARPIMPAVPPRLAGGHALLWLAAVAQMPGPLALIEQANKRPVAPLRPGLGGGSSPHRWSADAWAMVRGGGALAGAGPFAPTYGGSQIGAVLRYRLMPSNGHRPTTYFRATAALAAGGEREVAAGLSLRPVPRVPVVLAGEARVARIGDATDVRPAVVAVTEFAPVTLPAGTRAEFYLQGGYVGGRSATPFVDGSVRIDRHVAQVGPVEVRAGAGLWGGAQEGAQRLDIGPTATLGIAQGRGAARVGLDWRLRVAGEAAPASGPALTVSAGF
jgi:hypothetical protein